MKKGLKRIIIVLVVLIVVGAGGFIFVRGQAAKAQSAITYADIDMSRVADGTYYGQTAAGPVEVKVGVTVKDHAIQNVEIIEHKNGLGGKAEAVAKTMVEENTYKVDTVSGATLSSKVIMSAVSKALADGSR